MARLVDHSDFATVSIAIVGLVIYQPPARAPDLVLVTFGALLWTFIEYWIHRALHMKRFPRLRAFHMRHHQRPVEATGGTVYSTLVIALLSAAAIEWPVAAPALVGFLAAYLAFIVLHHAEHHGWPLHLTPWRRLAAAHDLHHHAGPNRAFGVTTTLWDRLFATA